MSADIDFYRTPGPMTDTSEVDGDLFSGLPSDTEALCVVSQGLIVHEFLAGAYGVGDVAGRVEELENRTVGELVDAITSLDPRPLVESRAPAHRLVGNCRQYAVLTCALLRRAGVPSRVRAGFSGYFDDSRVDHWIVERWDQSDHRWIRTDPQIDETQRGLFGIEFNPLDLPDGVFLAGSEAWQLCLSGGDDPERYGIQDMRGRWFIACNLLRDLAALNKVEVHAWDTWGIMSDLVFSELSTGQAAAIDRVAAAVVGGVLSEIRDVYNDDRWRVPDQVTSHRFQRTVDLPLAVATG